MTWQLAIEDSFISSGRKPKRIQTDQGREFYNEHVKKLLAKHDIELFSVKSPTKAALVERFNRSLKSKIWKMFTSILKQKRILFDILIII